MAFTIRSFRDIGQSLLNYSIGATTLLTDYTVGAVIRTALEAVAREIFRLEQDTARAIMEQAEQNTYITFNFPPLDPLPASGNVRCTRDPNFPGDITIAAGVTVGVPGTGQVYTVSANTLLAAGQSSVDVFVVSTQTGSGGNTPAATITALLTAVANVAAVTNANAFTNGRDQETVDERRSRFQSFLQTLTRGTVGSLAAGAKTAFLTDSAGNITEQVQRAQVFEAPGGGQATVYVHNGSGQTSSALVAQAQQVLTGYVDANGVTQPGYKAAGVPTTALAATDQPVAVTFQISLAPGFTLAIVKTDLTQAIMAVFRTLDVGDSLILSDLQAAARGVLGVLDCAFSAPTANVVPGAPGLMLLPGVITISVA